MVLWWICCLVFFFSCFWRLTTSIISSIFKVSKCELNPAHAAISLVLFFCFHTCFWAEIFSAFKDSHNYIQSVRIVQDKLFISTTSANSMQSPSCCVRLKYPQALTIGCGNLWLLFFCLPHLIILLFPPVTLITIHSIICLFICFYIFLLSIRKISWEQRLLICSLLLYPGSLA